MDWISLNYTGFLNDGEGEVCLENMFLVSLTRETGKWAEAFDRPQAMAGLPIICLWGSVVLQSLWFHIQRRFPERSRTEESPKSRVLEFPLLPWATEPYFMGVDNIDSPLDQSRA